MQNKHSFDLAKFGYVNLAPQSNQKTTINQFSKSTIDSQAGFYQPIPLKKLLEIYHLYHNMVIWTLVAEGYYARNLQAQLPDKHIYAFSWFVKSLFN